MHLALKKHFNQWTGQKNLPCMLGSDNGSVQAFEFFYFNREIPDTTFNSTAQKESINLQEFIEFVWECGFVQEKRKTYMIMILQLKSFQMELIY